MYLHPQSNNNHNSNEVEVRVYLSATNPYPTSSASSYQWKSSGHNEAYFLLDIPAWLYVHKYLYLGIELLPCNNKHINNLIAGEILVYLHSPTTHPLPTTITNNTLHNQRAALFDLWFHTITGPLSGPMISYHDREGIYDLAVFPDYYHPQDRYFGIDDHSLAYSELSYESVNEVLQAAEVIDGQVVYDLGSGIGKFVVGCALSGIHFHKIIGIEILPSLVLCSQQIVRLFTGYASSSSSSSNNNNTNNTNQSMHSGSSNTSNNSTLLCGIIPANHSHLQHNPVVIRWLQDHYEFIQNQILVDWKITSQTLQIPRIILEIRYDFRCFVFRVISFVYAVIDCIDKKIY